MSHAVAIGKLIKSISTSANHHAILIEGPPGWGKTRAVDDALKTVGVQAMHLGAYSTSLNFYNFLYENHDRFIVIDDTSGLLNDSISMAILKAATWQQAGKRIIRWRTNSNLAAAEEFSFSGKFIIICNSFPATADGDAIKSRSYVRPIHITAQEAKKLLCLAAEDKNWFPVTEIARTVAQFLAEQMTDDMVSKISYRTLEMGYDLAKDHPDDWESLLAPKIPSSTEDPLKVVRSLAKQKLKVKEQVRIFEEKTGLKRRTFFNYRNSANLAREQD
jgi:hypothetical protein